VIIKGRNKATLSPKYAVDGIFAVKNGPENVKNG
jgi:hypothetical protein